MSGSVGRSYLIGTWNNAAEYSGEHFETKVGEQVDKFKGVLFKNNKGLEFQVIDKIKGREYLVKFIESGYETVARRDCILSRSVSDPNFRSKCGVGFIGEGEYKTVEESRGGKGKATKAYSCWSGMMARCYRVSHQEYARYGGNQVTVCEEWHNFQNFAKFFAQNWEDGLQLDKDVLVAGNKVYCPDYCRFVPVYINNLLVFQKNVSNGLPIGVYYVKKGSRMVNEHKEPYGVEWRKKSLGTFSDPMNAHKAWQLNKADSIEETVKMYSCEKSFDKGIVDALLLRATQLRRQANQGEETLFL